MKKFILILLSFILNLFFVNCANAENFNIKNYNMDLQVNEDRSVNITENIDVYFMQQSHGIFRKIPLHNKIVRQNGTSNSENARITDIVSDNNIASILPDGDYLIIKMGNPDKYVNGNQHYNLKYKYFTGNDKLKNVDEFYFNIIGTKWDTYIDKVCFKITLPKEFDASKVGFSIGTAGTSGYTPSELKYSVEGNTIKGETNRKLAPHEALTIRIELPENYFTKTYTLEYSVTIIALVLALIPLLLWLIFGKDEPVVPIVSFEAPEGQNSAEVEVEYSGVSTNKGITSLIFYLASKGYLEIENDGICYNIKKLKPYDGNNSAENALMTALFLNNQDSVSQIELEANPLFGLYVSKIQKSLNNLKSVLFVKNSCSLGKMSLIIISILAQFVLFFYTISGFSFDFLTNGSIMLFLFAFIAIVVFIFLASTKNIALIIFALIWSSGFGGIPLGMLLFGGYIKIDDNYPVLIIELVCIVISIICCVNMPKRSYNGRMALGKILGLKKYLEVAEQGRLISIMNENPNYSSEILPFAYVLGVADNLLDTIAAYDSYRPVWYKGNFDRHGFNSFASSISHVAMYNSSRHSSGGHGRSHSGGGHSGGGGGGGGGGSW